VSEYIFSLGKISVHVIPRFVTRVHWYKYYVFLALSCLYKKCRPVYLSKERFGHWILSPSSGQTSVGSIQSPKRFTFVYKTSERAWAATRLALHQTIPMRRENHNVTHTLPSA
jgi:hypothetical protein